MQVEQDAVGNLRGLYNGSEALMKRLIIASHLDTVPNAGAFDGVLGVIMGLAIVESLGGERLPFAIEVIGFSEEEGVRFGLPFLGSRALTGSLDEKTLETREVAGGATIRQAIRDFGLDPLQLSQAATIDHAGAYLEFHIEQGPVLANLGSALGLVTAIVGQSRACIDFHGKANHAGTTPMTARHDALCAAAEWISAVETLGLAIEGLVATVGRLAVKPGAANVIPGQASATLDVRHVSDEIRQRACSQLLESARRIASIRSLEVETKVILQQDALYMNDILTTMAEKAIQKSGIAPHRMTSGAGHDAMIVAPRLPSAMIFLRSPNGVSHHPDETVLVEDVGLALHAGSQFLKDLCTCPLLT